MVSVGNFNIHLLLTANYMTREGSSTRTHPTSIKVSHTPATTTAFINPPLLIQLLISSNLSYIILIYLCCLPAPLPTLFFLVSYLTMVNTHIKNKVTHLAAPVMTKAAKEKAGIQPKCPKRLMKAKTIWQLQTCIAALENPNKESPSQKPLLCTMVILSLTCAEHLQCSVSERGQSTTRC